MKTQVNLKIDPSVKKLAQKKAKDIGLSLSSVVNASLKQFANTGELFLSSDYKTTPHLEKVIKEAREEYKKGKSFGPFHTVDKLMKSLDS
ncbi:type II toxin-antitoxin system RelB/DinJ family antitoxin [Patescibacteria group bacterium]